MLTTQKFTSADNQQVTDGWIPWLAGVMDGEGSIGIYKNGQGTYYVRVTITNTDQSMLDKITEVLESNNVRVYVQRGTKAREHWKDRWQMIFAGHTKPRGLLELVLPYLVTKKEEAELALEFIKSRHDKRYQNRKSNLWVNEPLTDREQWIVSRVKEIKKSGTSETIRATHNVKI